MDDAPDIIDPDSPTIETNDFAWSVALDGSSTAIVGLPRKDIGANADQGAVLVFSALVPQPPVPPPGNTPGPPVPPLPPTGLPPTITAIADQTVLVNGVVGPLSFTVGGRILADALEVTATSSDPVLVAPSSLVLGRISGAVRTLTLRPGGWPHGQCDDHRHRLGRVQRDEHAFSPERRRDDAATGASPARADTAVVAGGATGRRRRALRVGCRSHVARAVNGTRTAICHCRWARAR